MVVRHSAWRAARRCGCGGDRSPGAQRRRRLCILVWDIGRWRCPHLGRHSAPAAKAGRRSFPYRCWVLRRPRANHVDARRARAARGSGGRGRPAGSGHGRPGRTFSTAPIEPLRGVQVGHSDESDLLDLTEQLDHSSPRGSWAAEPPLRHRRTPHWMSATFCEIGTPRAPPRPAETLSGGLLVPGIRKVSTRGLRAVHLGRSVRERQQREGRLRPLRFPTGRT